MSEQKPTHRMSVLIAFVLGAVFLGCFCVGRVGTGLLIHFLLVIGGVTAPIGFGIFIVIVAWLGSVGISVSSARKHNRFRSA